MGMSKLKENMDVAMKENSVIYLEDDYKKNYDGFDPNSIEKKCKVNNAIILRKINGPGRGHQAKH